MITTNHTGKLVVQQPMRIAPPTSGGLARNEDSPAYLADAPRPGVEGMNDDLIIGQALAIVVRRLKRGPAMDSPRAVRDFFCLRAAGLEKEVFTVMFLDAQHQVIAVEDLFNGTLTQTSVYPREVVKAALSHNAGAVILAHNHPSGSAEPSRADEYLTGALKSALALVDVRVLDHVVTGGAASVSFAERGLL